MIEQVYDGSDCYPEIVREYWKSHPNYLIEFNEKTTKDELVSLLENYGK